ncbi:urate hydroxylase PuuD, partial [Sinorhizobium meliloti]|uniref:urate hydroxylase PuuD n=1 Tax=Rhizobium meliloti TaxID=382 RepID=UPI001F34F708
MYEYAIAWDWLTFAVRWLHVITGIAWIGSSFYFVALDLGLKQRPGMPVGAYGEEWQVHGGGFYHIQKYLVAPENMPERDCQEFCAVGRFHQLKNRSPKMTANCVFASTHS